MKIGVFDSGIGGLTVFREIARRFPQLDIIYLGDTARVPYGTKSPETVVRYSFEAAHFLGHHGIELLVVACNTSTALALEALQKDLAIPTIGVIQPGARRAVQTTRNGRIGVIGTPATIRSDAYARAIHEASEASASGLRSEGTSVHVISRPCPLFVPLAEEGWTDNAVALETARIYLEPFEREGVDTLVLGCTHYPLLRSAIATVMGPDVALVDSAEPVAEEVGERMNDHGNADRDAAREPSRSTPMNPRLRKTSPSGDASREPSPSSSMSPGPMKARHSGDSFQEPSGSTPPDPGPRKEPCSGEEATPDNVSGGRVGTRRFFVTDSRERFREVGARFLQEPIEDLEQVSIVGE